MTIVIPFLIAECTKLRARGLEYAEIMSKEWVRLALSNSGLLCGLLLNASRHLSKVYRKRHHPRQQLFANLAIRYKLLCVQSLSAAIISGAKINSYNDSVVAQTLILAFDEVGVRPCSSDPGGTCEG